MPRGRPINNTDIALNDDGNYVDEETTEDQRGRLWLKPKVSRFRRGSNRSKSKSKRRDSGVKSVGSLQHSSGSQAMTATALSDTIFSSSRSDRASRTTTTTTVEEGDGNESSSEFPLDSHTAANESGRKAGAGMWNIRRRLSLAGPPPPSSSYKSPKNARRSFSLSRGIRSLRLPSPSPTTNDAKNKNKNKIETKTKIESDATDTKADVVIPQSKPTGPTRRSFSLQPSMVRSQGTKTQVEVEDDNRRRSTASSSSSPIKRSSKKKKKKASCPKEMPVLVASTNPTKPLRRSLSAHPSIATAETTATATTTTSSSISSENNNVKKVKKKKKVPTTEDKEKLSTTEKLPHKSPSTLKKKKKSKTKRIIKAGTESSIETDDLTSIISHRSSSVPQSDVHEPKVTTGSTPKKTKKKTKKMKTGESQQTKFNSSDSVSTSTSTPKMKKKLKKNKEQDMDVLRRKVSERCLKSPKQPKRSSSLGSLQGKKGSKEKRKTLKKKPKSMQKVQDDSNSVGSSMKSPPPSLLSISPLSTTSPGTLKYKAINKAMPKGLKLPEPAYTHSPEPQLDMFASMPALRKSSRPIDPPACKPQRIPSTVNNLLYEEIEAHLSKVLASHTQEEKSEQPSNGSPWQSFDEISSTQESSSTKHDVQMSGAKCEKLEDEPDASWSNETPIQRDSMDGISDPWLQNKFKSPTISPSEQSRRSLNDFFSGQHDSNSLRFHKSFTPTSSRYKDSGRSDSSGIKNNYDKQRGSTGALSKSCRSMSVGTPSRLKRAIVSDWTAPIEANDHWSSSHDKRSDHGSLGGTSYNSGPFDLTVPLKTSSHTKASGSGFRSLASSSNSFVGDVEEEDDDDDEDLASIFEEDVFQSDGETTALNDEIQEEKSALRFANVSRTFSDTSFGTPSLDGQPEGFDEDFSNCADEDKSFLQSSTKEEDEGHFEILQMTPRTQKRYIGRKRIDEALPLSLLTL